MKIKELIEELQELEAKYGDVEINIICYDCANDRDLKDEFVIENINSTTDWIIK